MILGDKKLEEVFYKFLIDSFFVKSELSIFKLDTP